MVQQKGRLNLTEEERNTIAQWLLQNSKNFKVKHGGLAEAATKFGCHRNTIHSIWKTAQAQLHLGGPIHLKSKKKGRKMKVRKPLDISKIKSLSVLERTSYRLMALNLKVSKSLVALWYKRRQLRAHTNAIKPALTAANKFNRLKWSLKQLTSTIINGKVQFQKMDNVIHVDEKWFYLSKQKDRYYQKMDNVIHVDEKWFYLSKQKDRYYLLPGEAEPYRSCKSKRFIDKLMFLAAVSKPQYSADGTCIFDRKIGIFPFTKLEPAARKSKNRPKGTLITKPIHSVNTAVMKYVYINKLIPAVMEKWPESASKHIIIQQDNARPHIKPDDPDFIKAANINGFHIELVNQPANSRDCNVNDLGFFRAIQTLKDRKTANGVDDLLQNVMEAFDEFETYKLTKVFLTLQGCYKEIMKHKGSNNYKIPHMNKDRHIREGSLPENLEVDSKLVDECITHLNHLAQVNEDIQSIDELVNAFNVMGMQA